MAVSKDLSKLSDELGKLAARAKEAEDRVAASRDKTKADLEADREQARAVGEQQAQALREQAEGGRDRISSAWADMQRSWDEGVAKMRADIESRKAEHDVHKAQRRADRAEDEARFAIDFAYSTVVEAEYAIYDAAIARMEADDLSNGRRPRRLTQRCISNAEEPIPGSSALLLPSGRAGDLPLSRLTLSPFRCSLRFPAGGAREYAGITMNRTGERERAGAGRGRRDIDLASPGGRLATTRKRSIQGLVRREALFEQLSATPAGDVIFVCAPAGSGKTMLLRGWVEAEGLAERTAWVAVEPGDQDAQRFWLGVIDALAGPIDGSVERIGPKPGFRGRVAVERLLNDLRLVEEPLVLVIDDLHELQSPEALSWLELFIARRPPNLQVVLTSRTEPQLGLHHLRLTGELTEIRGSDLRFSREETGELLRTSDLVLSDESVGLLHERTEGWVAGLRLAAISLAEHRDPERFVREFSGSERTVAGYLMAEVLERQPPEVRELLLRTSILDRITGRLADVITGRSGSERILHDLERANAFVTSLDVDHAWFRYHRLFADFLRLELRRTDPASIDSLHRTAARWYEENGHPTEAIRHAQAATEWAYAARLLADSYVSLILDGRLGTVRALLDAFPAEAPGEDPELAIVMASARLFDGRHDDSAAYIELADRRAATVPEERRRRFDLRVAGAKLWLARRRVDLPAALEAMRAVEAALEAQPASDLARAYDHRAAAAMNLGIAELWSLRADDARRHLEEGLSLAQHAERPYLEIGCLAHLGIAAPDGGGSALEGFRYAERAIETAEALGWGDDPIITPALAIGGVVHMWLGRFDDAERRLEQADCALRPETEPMTALVVRWATGLLRLIQGRLEEALAGLAEAQRLKSSMQKEVQTIEPRGVMLQAQVRMGETEAATAALEGLDGDERDRALIRIAAAEIHLAQDDPEAALDELAPVLDGSARSSHQTTSVIDALLFVALARDRLGDARATEEAIERALEVAEPEGIIVPFAVAPVEHLLERHPRHRTSHAALLSEILDVLSGAADRASGAAPPPADELSEAELRVVRFLPSNSEGAGDRGRALRLAEHGADAPAPHLLQARRAQPSRGCGARTRARAAGAVADRLVLAGHRSAQLGSPKTATTAIANPMPVKKATQAHLSARQASRPAINACDR